MHRNCLCSSVPWRDRAEALLPWDSLWTSNQQVQNPSFLSDCHAQDSTDWTHRHAGHLLAKVRAGTSQAEQPQTKVIKTPFQKHSIKLLYQSSQEPGERPGLPIPLLLQPKPQLTACSRKNGCNYLFWVPSKIPSHTSFCSWLRVVPQPMTAQSPSQLGSTLVPPASRRSSSLQGWQVGAAWSDLISRPAVPGTTWEHRTDREQSEGAGGLSGGTGGDGCSFQLPQEDSLWHVFSGNLELGLFLDH